MYVNREDIVPFKNHTFQVKDDAEMYELQESIKAHGILEPGIAFYNENGELELVSGHRRNHICELLEMPKMPLLIKNITRDEAIIIMGETNLQRRKDILPSEKARTYKMMLDAMKRQGKRTDLTSSPEGTKSRRRSDDELAKKVNDSKTMIHRYIRLTFLNENLLGLVDIKKMGLKPAEEISYLDSNLQEVIWEFFEENEVTPSHAQAIMMRKLAKEGLLDRVAIERLLSEEKPNQRESLKISSNIIDKYLSNCKSNAEMENRIIKALALLEKQEKITGKDRELELENEL